MLLIINFLQSVITLLILITSNLSLCSVMESTVQSAVDETRRKLQPLISHIDKQTSVGASILHKRLAA